MSVSYELIVEGRLAKIMGSSIISSPKEKQFLTDIFGTDPSNVMCHESGDETGHFSLIYNGHSAKDANPRLCSDHEIGGVVSIRRLCDYTP